MASRLPYAIAKKQVRIRWFRRFGLNKPLKFTDVKESTWGRIYRRSLVIQLNVRFVPKQELGGRPVTFAKDGALGDFLESRHAGAVFIRLLFRHLSTFNIEESQRMIDDYARKPGWITWIAMRLACNLDQEVATDTDELEFIAPAEEESRRIEQLGDALEVSALDKDTEITGKPWSIGAFRKILGKPHRVNAPKKRPISEVHISER